MALPLYGYIILGVWLLTAGLGYLIVRKGGYRVDTNPY